MKHINAAILRQTCIAWVMIAAAPHVGAQAPSPAPKTPAAADTPAAASAPAAAPAPSIDQISYLFGLTFGEQLHHFGITDQISFDALTRGMKDGLQGKKGTPADQQQLQAYMRSVAEAALAKNQAAAKDFLEHNGHEKGVTTTASGLQYKVIAPGDRKAPAVAPTDQVTVQYRGKLLDGTEFDSTYSRGTPMPFTVNGVIPGWQEALTLMKPGAKWQVFVPPELAYGANPQRGIPGGSLLIFEVELVSVKPSGTPAAPTLRPDIKPAPQTH
jgi:FKBP-type peptidyl-prolyl cis-trans isomerase FklB